MIHPILRFTLANVYKLWLIKAQGLENLPKDRPFIIAANHSSYYDSMLLHCIIIPKIDKKIHALVNSSYWNYPIARKLLNIGECIPVSVVKNKNLKNQNEDVFKKAVEYLKKGEIIQIFPEGTRSIDGELKKAYTGIAKICLYSNVPVLPVGIIGSYKVLPKGKFFPRFIRCDVNIGKLIYFDKYYKKKVSNSLLEKITKDIMEEIARLIGGKYK